MRATDNREGQVPFVLMDMPTVLFLQPPREGGGRRLLRARFPRRRVSAVPNRGTAYRIFTKVIKQ